MRINKKKKELNRYNICEKNSIGNRNRRNIDNQC